MKTNYKWEIQVLMKLFLVLLGSNSTDLLWLKGWLISFLQLKGKWCLLILGGFPKTFLIMKLSLNQRNMLILYKYWYLINVWCAHCMETLTICYMKNLWDNLNLSKFICVEKSLYFWVLWLDYLLWASWNCFESYGKSWLKAQCCISL